MNILNNVNTKTISKCLVGSIVIIKKPNLIPRHKCCLCSFTCKSFEKFSNHVEKTHSLAKLSAEKAPLVCTFCPYVVAMEYQKKFDEHVKKCKEAFEIESSLKAKSSDKDNSVSHKVKEVSQSQIDTIQECPTNQLQEVSQSDPSGIPAHATVPLEVHLPLKAFPQIFVSASCLLNMELL